MVARAVGHADGLSTLIQSRGKATGTFDDLVSFRWVAIPVYDVASGDWSKGSRDVP